MSPEDRGKTIHLGIATYDAKAKHSSEIAFLSPIATIPNPPELLTVKQNFDNIVKLEWSLPVHKTEIRGYLVERSTDQIYFETLGIASGNSYTDLGSRYKAPMNDCRYYYQVSAITYAGVQSSHVFATVNVVLKQEAPVPTMMAKKIPDLPPGNYRIKAVGTDEIGETSWINMHSSIINTKPGYPEIPSIRLRTITSEGDTSLTIKTQNLAVELKTSEIINNENEPEIIFPYGALDEQVYRIRAVSVDGVESYALLSTIVNHVPAPNFIVNKSIDYIADKKQSKLVNKGG